MTDKSVQAKVLAMLLRRRNGANERQIADAALPLEKATYVRDVLNAMVAQGEATLRQDDKGVVRYFAPGKAPPLYGSKARPARHPAPALPSVPPAVPPPRRTPPEAPPASPPAGPRKLRPRADVNQPIAPHPGDILAAQVTAFLQAGGKIQKLASGEVSRPLKCVGPDTKPVLFGRRARATI